MLMQKKMGLVVASVTVLLTVMTFAPYLMPVTVSSDGITPGGTMVETSLAHPATIAYWELNENTGSIIHDSVGSIPDGDTMGGPNWITGIAQSGLELLPNQYVDFGSSPDFYSTYYVAIEAWVNLQDVSGLHTILQNSFSSVYTMYNFAIEDGHLYFIRQSGLPGTSFTSTETIRAGEWYHVAVVMKWLENTISFYINGDEEIRSGYNDGFSGPTGRVTVGADLSTREPTSYLEGMIDEVAIYEAPIAGSVFEEHYQKGLLGLGYLDDFPVNEAPVAVDDLYTMDQDTALTVSAPGVLANDIDDDGDSLETDFVTGPSNGGLALYPDGSFVYTPTSGFVGIDAFEYRAFDGTDYSNAATVTITVEAVNHPPVAVDDAYVTDEDVFLSITSSSLLANDYDPEPFDTLSVELVTEPQHGFLMFHSEGNFEYIPDTDWFGIDTFTYRVFDGQVYGNDATVTITVNEVNDAPVATDDAYSGLEDLEMAHNVLDNDYDLEGDSLEVTLVSGPAHGSLDIYPDGSFTYLPDSNWFGIDSFTYQVYDGLDYSSVATATLTIEGVNDVPVAVDDAQNGVEDLPLTYNTILANDYDLDGDTLQAYLVTGPSHGVLELLSTGMFTYTPNPNWFGDDSFTYYVNDGQEYSNVATVTITISGVNDAPAASDLNYYAAESSTLSILSPEDILTLGVTDIDTASELLEVHLVDGPAVGTLTLNADGSFDYSVTGWFGTVTFTYRVFDGTDYSNIATVTIYDVGDDDTTGPEISIIYFGDGTDGSPGSWAVTVVDPESGIDWIKVEIDGVVVATTAGTYSVPNSLGIHSITVTAANADIDFGPDDQETSTLSDAIYIVDDDVTPPNISITYTGDLTDINPGFWTVTASDLESGIYSILVVIDGIIMGSAEGDYAVPSSLGIHFLNVTVSNNDIDRPYDQERQTDVVTAFIEQSISYTEITYTGDISGVYSDPVYLEALLLDASDQSPIPGKTIMFTLGTQTAYAVTNADGVASVTIILDQEGGFYELVVSFAEDDDYLGSSSTTVFVILRECASTIYSGVTLVEVSEESITLMATVFDHADGYWGDVTHIYVTFTFYLSSDPLTPVHTTCPVRVQAIDVAGVGVATLEIPNLPDGDYLVTVSLLPEHNRYYCAPDSQAAAITIYEPERAFVKGVGVIKDAEGHNGYFAFRVYYSCKGNLKGFFVYSYRDGDWIHFMRSCDILGFSTEDNHGFFEANVTIGSFNFKTHEIVCSDDKYRMRVDVFDNRRNRGKDAFQFSVFDNLGLVEYEAGFDPFGYLMKGCIVVKHYKKH